MTADEACQWEVRLTRIWLCADNHRPMRVCHRFEGHQFRFHVELGEGVEMEVIIERFDRKAALAVTLAQFDLSEPSRLLQSLSCDDCDVGLRSEVFGAPRDEEFVLRWLDWFRRNCWLAGCLIEATAHEKVIWLHDFAREEVEAWGLRF